MKYWSGTKIKKLDINEIFVYGANPEFRNGAGGAKAAVAFGSKVYGSGRGIVGNTIGVITKNLIPGYKEEATGIVYTLAGERSVSPEMISENIDELYKIALEHKDKQFLISYQFETYPNGTPKKSLNGYTSQEMLEMFVRDDIPDNIVFHDSYKPHLEKIFNKTQSNIESIPQKEVPPKEPKKTFDDVINFTRVALPFGWMGNMAPYPVEHEGVKYKTTEALFQALRFTAYPDIQDKIRNEASPMSAKMVAKSHKDLLEASGYELLGAQDVANMKLCVRLKLEQHPQLAQQLIDSGKKPIIEDCTSRPQGSGVFWGSAYQNGAWTGKNVLGEILMDARKQLQNTASPVQNTVSPQYTYFFHLTSPFSNFHPAKMEYKDLTFISNEQFMMYSKAKNFKDEVSAAKILDLNKTPIAQDFIDEKITREQIVNNKDWADEWNKLMMSVKKLGRGVQNYDDVVWTNKREKIVLFGARLKFTQNEDLKQILLNTGNTIMVEASKYDPIWSCGLSEYDAKKTDPSKWPGLNLLGKVLDTLKIELQNELININETNLKKKDLDKPIEVHHFFRLGKVIPEDGEYIGRANKNFNLTRSLFANPFEMKDKSEEEITRVIAEFKDFLWQQISENKFTKKDLLALTGKKLICWCAPFLSSDTEKIYKLSIKDNSSVELEMTKEEFFGQLDINPLDYIRIVNVRGNKENQAQPDEKLIAAHRANPTLGNPFVMKDKSDAERSRVIEEYKKHLEKDLNSEGPIYKLLNKIADDIIEKKEKIALSCWCAPQACHAHEIAKVLSLMIIEKRLLQPIESHKVNLKNKR